MKTATKKNLIFKQVRGEYDASTWLRKTIKAQLQGQIIDLQTKVEVAMHKKPITLTTEHQGNAAHLGGGEGNPGEDTERHSPSARTEGQNRRDATENPRGS